MMKLAKSKHNYRGYSYFSTKYKKNKSDWSGSSPADAFRPNLSTTSQLPSRKKLWDVCHANQEKVMRYFHKSDIKIKPQVAHFYLFPPVLAALSCIGLTAFLEAKEHARSSQGLLEVYNANFINEPHSRIHSELPVVLLQKLARMVAKVIDNRMIIQVLHKTLGIEYVEMYRVISSTLIDMDNIYSLEQCVSLNLIYGDLFLPLDKNKTALAHFWSLLSRYNKPYIDDFSQLEDSRLLSAATEWHVKLTQKIAGYFSSGTAGQMHIKGKASLVIMDKDAPRDLPASGSEKIYINTADIVMHQHDPGAYLGIDHDSMMVAFAALDEESQSILKNLANSVHQTTNYLPDHSSHSYHGLLDDVRKDPWGRTPVEGSPTDGCEISIGFGEYEVTDIVYDQALPLSYDFGSIAKIKECALPITQQLKRILYVSPGFESSQTLASSGANFNGRSLPVYQVSENLFSKNQDDVTLSNHGQSIVVLAADSSGSNSQDQIDCIKILSASFIGAAKSKKNKLEFLGATYDSCNKAGHSTITRWIYNERINESRTFDDALHRVDSIVSNGGNSDVKSWARILEEVNTIIRNKPILRKAHVYFIIISDCMFNKSFSGTPFSAATEVQEYINIVQRKTWKDRIHITLVSLSAGVSALDSLVDLKLTITNNEMKNPGQSAQEISAFVSKAIKQQREKLKS